MNVFLLINKSKLVVSLKKESIFFVVLIKDLKEKLLNDFNLVNIFFNIMYKKDEFVVRWVVK